MNLFDQLERDFARVVGQLPRPVCPSPASVMPRQHELPEDRSDFTRDSEASGT